MPVYRDLIIPLADVLTPNAFELGELTGSPIETEEDCLKAVGELHAKGVKTIVVTSGVTGAQTQESLRCYASVHGSDCYRFTFPRLMGQFVGTGELELSKKLSKIPIESPKAQNSKVVIAGRSYLFCVSRPRRVLPP